MNPVHAELVSDPEDYPWSSARFHLNTTDDSLISGSPLKSMVLGWRKYLMGSIDEEKANKLKQACHVGRPLGPEPFFDILESQLGRNLRPQRPGPS
jgi:putative transposase